MSKINKVMSEILRREKRLLLLKYKRNRFTIRLGQPGVIPTGSNRKQVRMWVKHIEGAIKCHERKLTRLRRYHSIAL